MKIRGLSHVRKIILQTSMFSTVGLDSIQRIEVVLVQVYSAKPDQIAASFWHFIFLFIQSKKEDNDQESIQSSTTPDPGYQ